MTRINLRSFSLAFGLTGALIYFGCMVLMFTVGQEGTISFFNSILHGFDTTSVVRMDVPLWEAALGVVETFVVAWLIGACIAAIYNATLPSRET